jgi:ribosomal protein L11 methyltransferase
MDHGGKGAHGGPSGRSSSPALELDFPAGPEAHDLAERLPALLDDVHPVAIDEGTYAPDAEQAPPSRWRVYFASADERDRAARELGGDPSVGGVTVRAVDVEDENWVERSQAQLSAICVGRVLVAPPWDRPSVPDAVVVFIRPSTGFGTGHHASTRLCLHELQRLDPAGRSVIDVGTGSGVLAIAAAKLGAAAVAAFDCDPEALANARENAETSGVADRVVLHVADLSDAATLPLAPADLVFANLTAGVIPAYAVTLGRLVAPGGALVVSGILLDQVAAVTSALGLAGFSVVHSDREDEWAVLTLRAGDSPRSVVSH